MHRFRSVISRFTLVSAALVLFGCAGGPKLAPPSGVIGGISAANSRIILRQEQSAKIASNVSYVLPAGDYRPAYEDTTGVYYEAPSKVIQKEIFLGMNIPDRPFAGGIFLERANPGVAKVYIITPANEGGEIMRLMKGGRPAKPILPRAPIQFELTKP
jgi:hypothetical protein